jgi:SpoIID/LytB domain protein
VRLIPTASRARIAALGLASVALASASLSLAPQSLTPQAGAATLTTLTITGHGYGHGRGMGQYGAYGYALAGWTYPQILSHYYGGTAPSSVDPSEPITVHLTEFDSSAEVTPGPGGDTTVSEGDLTRYYQGSVEVIGSQVYDVVPLDDYVAGVVPAESPASWGSSSLGLNALEAQAVAARSYALAYVAAEGSICDSTGCQVYDGDPNVAGSATNSIYTTYSDQAVSDTSGQVLLCQASACGASGSVALTEFSSSTGGYTAGGAFPAVPDGGDATPSNPNHTWTVTVPASTVEAAYPSVGGLTAVTVTSRNGLGDLGGRVLTLTVSGTSASVTTTGTAFAAAVGLMSNWFSFTGPGSTSGPGTPALSATPTVASGGDDGYWIVGSDGSIFDFGDAPSLGSMVGQSLNGPIVAMAPTADQNGYWLVGSDGGIFSFGDAVFHGSTGGLRLNRPVLGMAATPDGGGYWLVAADGGVFNFGDAGFYGSTGSLRLNQPVVGMVPTADGKGYTLVGRDGGVFTFGDAKYVGSLPGLGIRATVTGVAATADGLGYLEVGADGSVYAFGDAPFEGAVSSVDPGWQGQALGIFVRRGS